MECFLVPSCDFTQHSIAYCQKYFLTVEILYYSKTCYKLEILVYFLKIFFSRYLFMFWFL